MMRKYMLLTTGLLACCWLSGCGDDTEGQVANVKKEGSVEIAIKTQYASDYTLLTTTHKVWIAGKLHKTSITTDTLPVLKPTQTVVEGQRKTMPKEYELYITVQ